MSLHGMIKENLPQGKHLGASAERAKYWQTTNAAQRKTYDSVNH